VTLPPLSPEKLTLDGWAVLVPIPGARSSRRTDRAHYFHNGRSLCGRRWLSERGYQLELLVERSRFSPPACAKCDKALERRRRK
jgi:hypothetical protein